ncbi:MAG TPA: chitobiase/beta-hexosaminidase C-terminal domain-containing protein [Verrucomicrobiae bacterium]|nr:chitobiase/beta-hexosaminidase C-terminal domain-containing protein [Verrucomicrobiae bacterium]
MRQRYSPKLSNTQMVSCAKQPIREAIYRTRKTGSVVLLLATLILLAVFNLASNKAPCGFPLWRAQTVHAQSTNSYTFTDFQAADAGTGVLQGTMGTSINDSGDIAGIYLNTNGTATNVAHGFVRTANGTITEFDSPHAGNALNQGTFPTSINASDEIAGMYFDANNAYHGFVRSASGAITEFDAPGAPTTVGHRGTLPIAIDSAGDIAGIWVDDTSDVRHGFVRTSAGAFTSFDVSGAGTSATEGTVPLSINATGSITGFYKDANATFHGFLRDENGTITSPIDAPGAGTGGSSKLQFSGTVATSINSAGDLAGVYANGGNNHGFIYTASSTTPTFTTFDAPGMVTAGLFPGTLAASMNAAGTISGVYTDGQGDHHGFVRAPNGTFTAPIDGPNAVYENMFSGTVLIAINASGQVTGTYEDANYVFHAFLAVPAQGTAAATPTFNPAGGTYTSAQTVTLSDSTNGATIYYTTDGSTPPTSATTSTYTDPITVNSTQTIQAIATASGFSNSALASATYTINLPAPDFQLSVSPSSLTIVKGQSGTATFTVKPLNGFNSAVSFSCSGLPAETTCTFNPTSVTPNGSPATATLVVQTTAKGSAFLAPLPRSRPYLYLYASMFALLATWLAFATFRKQRRIPAPVWAMLILLVVSAGLASCGGGGGGGKNQGTPVGTSTVSITAATTGGSGTSHAASLTITVTQ